MRGNEHCGDDALALADLAVLFLTPLEISLFIYDKI